MNLRGTIEISVMAGAAFLEVGGDALIRKGLRGGGLTLVVLGFGILGSYGVLLTLLELDFSTLLGAYVGLFALTTMLFGRLVFRERISTQTWVGLSVVLLGSLIIQLDHGTGAPLRGPVKKPDQGDDRQADESGP